MINGDQISFVRPDGGAFVEFIGVSGMGRHCFDGLAQRGDVGGELHGLGQSRCKERDQVVGRQGFGNKLLGGGSDFD